MDKTQPLNFFLRELKFILLLDVFIGRLLRKKMEVTAQTLDANDGPIDSFFQVLGLRCRLHYRIRSCRGSGLHCELCLCV